MSATPPDLAPSRPEPQLAQALQRARIAIAWERSWPHLGRLLSVVGLFLVASWAGLWLMLPSVARAIERERLQLNLYQPA